MLRKRYLYSMFCWTRRLFQLSNCHPRKHIQRTRLRTCSFSCSDLLGTSQKPYLSHYTKHDTEPCHDVYFSRGFKRKKARQGKTNSWEPETLIPFYSRHRLDDEAKSSCVIGGMDYVGNLRGSSQMSYSATSTFVRSMGVPCCVNKVEKAQQPDKRSRQHGQEI